MAHVAFGPSEEAWKGHTATVQRLIEQNGLKQICEIGGGANPALPLDYIQRNNLCYTILDTSAAELAKAPEGYNKTRGDITDEDLWCRDAFDLMFSKMLAEHIKDGEAFHRNVHRLLSSGGIAFHFFPTLFALPFVVNRIVPERIASGLLDMFAPRDEYQHGKFPTYYSWCRGPTKNQLDRFTDLGYAVMEYRGFFGHEGYYQKLPLLQKVSRQIAHCLLKHPVAHLTSYAYVVLKKPT